MVRLGRSRPSAAAGSDGSSGTRPATAGAREGRSTGSARPSCPGQTWKTRSATGSARCSTTREVSAAASSLIILVIAAVVIAAAVVGFLVFGLPRINRRSAVGGNLFGEDDDRDLGCAAPRRAASGRRGRLHDGHRGAVPVDRTRAGRTHDRHDVPRNHRTRVRRTGRSSAFPGFSADLKRTAATFDAVRYLGATGTEAQWHAIATLEAGLRAARPELEPVDA